MGKLSKKFNFFFIQNYKDVKRVVGNKASKSFRLIITKARPNLLRLLKRSKSDLEVFHIQNIS